MLFLVSATDGPDTQALRTRLRNEHMQALFRLKAEGVIVDAGAKLGADGQICGSIIVLDVPGRPEVDAYLAAEPFARDGVWAIIEATGFRSVQWPG
jgi:uncharacterized protein YciI